jgi:hypothetical protein
MLAGQQQVDVAVHRATWFEENEPPQIVPLILQVSALLQRRDPRNIDDAPDDHAATLATGMTVDDGDGVLPSHLAVSFD